MTAVRMYSRAACGLCDEARTVVNAVRAERPFEFEEVLIDREDDLERAYGTRVPVLLVDGREEFELVVDADALRALVGASRDA
jgi:glutaredoxin